MTDDKKYYPLTPAQRVLVFELKYCPFAQIVNISYEIEMKEGIEPLLLCRAIEWTLQKNQAASIRLHKTEKGVKQYFSDEKVAAVEYVDFTGKRESQYEKQLVNWSKKPFPNKHMDTCLYVMRVVRKPNGRYGIYGCFSHLIYDIFGLAYLHKNILAVYQALLNGTEVPDVSTSILEVYEKEFKYPKSEKHDRDRAFYDSELYKTEPQYTSVNGLKAREFSTKTRYGSFCVSPFMRGGMLDLPVDMTIDKAVLEYAMGNGVSSQACYLLAVRTWLAHGCGVDDVTFTNVVSRRATLAQKKAGGTMANGLLFRTIIDKDASFEKGCNIVFNNLASTYRHPDIDAGEVVVMGYEKFGTPKLKTYSGMGFSYCNLPVSGQNMPMSFRRIPTGKETLAAYCTLIPCDTEGNLIINYSFLKDFVSEETIRSFHHFIMKFMEYGVAHPTEKIEAITQKILGQVRK